MRVGADHPSREHRAVSSNKVDRRNFTTTDPGLAFKSMMVDRSTSIGVMSIDKSILSSLLTCHPESVRFSSYHHHKTQDSRLLLVLILSCCKGSLFEALTSGLGRLPSLGSED